MHLVEILLPIVDNDVFRREVRTLEKRLTDKFGGVTAFLRAPGEGLWNSGTQTVSDRIVVIEVMAPAIDHVWWRGLRTELEQRLGQEEIVIRTHAVEQL